MYFQSPQRLRKRAGANISSRFVQERELTFQYGSHRRRHLLQMHVGHLPVKTISRDAVKISHMRSLWGNGPSSYLRPVRPLVSILQI